MSRRYAIAVLACRRAMFLGHRAVQVVLRCLSVLLLVAGPTGLDAGFAQPRGAWSALSQSADIGRVAIPGSAQAKGDGLRVSGSGGDIWNREDGFHFAYGQISGDFSAVVRVESLEASHDWAKAGIMLREDLVPEASQATVLATPEHGVALQRRVGAGNVTWHSGGSDGEAPIWLRLERRGETISSYESPDAETWTLIATETLHMKEDAYLGLAVTSPGGSAVATAVFSDFAVEAAGGSDSSEISAASDRTRGLHFTAAELETWRNRSRSGPYRTAGDVSPNSPGDWERILDNANGFLDDPEQAWWPRAQGASGCVMPNFDNPPLAGSDNMRDASFVYLLVGGDRYLEAAKAMLLRLASNPNLDMSNRAIWCPGRLADSSFMVAQWFLKNLFVYDYLGPDAFTPTQRSVIEDWMENAASFFLSEVERSLEALFVNRSRGDYRLTEVARSGCGDLSHLGGHDICALHRYYNNRRTSQIQFVGIAGLYFKNDAWVKAAKDYFQEWLRFSVFPDGMMGEYERWQERLPDLGWAYAANIVASMVTLAEHYARNGDTSLFEYTTDEGALGTEGGRKSLLLTIHTLGAHVDGSVQNYGSDRARHSGDPNYLIDGLHEPSRWHGLHDILIAHSNLYYQDPYIRAIYTRTGDGMPGYPAEPAPNGPRVVWTGDWGLYPGLLFMYGGLEGEVWPYGEAGPDDGSG